MTKSHCRSFCVVAHQHICEHKAEKEAVRFQQLPRSEQAQEQFQPACLRDRKVLIETAKLKRSAVRLRVPRVRRISKHHAKTGAVLSLEMAAGGEGGVFRA